MIDELWSDPSVTNLIGRDDDVAGVVDLLSQSRLVTVTGPGGVGKSRVAVAAASEVAAHYRDGLWLVDAGSVDDGPALWAALAPVCGIELDRVQTGARRTLCGLQQRRVLLVLDNCDRLMSACTEIAVSVAQVCPDASLLLTSRQPLGVEGERLWQVKGLAPERPGQFGRGTLATSPAVRLFLDTARARRPDLVLTPEETDVVAKLCRRLDGLPLAIHWAAARAGVLTPTELLERLDDPFALLAGGRTNAPPRHRSLAAMLGWSHDLLPEHEAVLFRRLAVFEGDFSLEAAEDVCSAPPLHDVSVLDGLAALVAKSLVVADPTGGETRYRLLCTTRAYAANLLASTDDAASLRERHARWYLGLAGEPDEDLDAPAPDSWIARLALDQENLRAALEWMVDAGRSSWALEMVAAMVPFWRETRRFGTGRAWLAEALAMPDQPAPLRVGALHGLGYLVGESGDRPGAIRPLEEALRLAEEEGDAGAQARVLNQLGYIRLFCDVPSNALTSLGRSTEIAIGMGDRPTLLESLATAGWAASLAGDARLAEARFSECLMAAQESEHEGATWPAVVGLGWAAMTQGHFSEAERRLTEASRTAARARSAQAESVVQCRMGQLARARGDYAQAAALLRRAVSYAQEVANPFPTAIRLALLGLVAHDQGDLDGAEATLAEAVAVPGATQLPFARAHALMALGTVRVTQRRPGEAAPLLLEASAIASTHGFHGITAAVLVQRARLRWLDQDLGGAARVLTQAIRLHDHLGDGCALVDSLEVLGGLRARQGRCRTACRLLAAADTARSVSGIARSPVRLAHYEADLAVARSDMSPEAWDAVWAAGAGLSMAGAAAVAIRGHGRRDSPRTGWDAITPAEREVLALVAKGLTNREAAAALVVSVRTVETHVANVVAKLGLASRRELARATSARGFAASHDHLSAPSAN